MNKRFKKKLLNRFVDPIGHLMYKRKAKNVQSVVLMLGPYRNLTTFIAGILALHPNCCVLNHAGVRILRRNHLNFLKDYSAEKLENFKGFALYASKGDIGQNSGGIFFMRMHLMTLN